MLPLVSPCLLLLGVVGFELPVMTGQGLGRAGAEGASIPRRWLGERRGRISSVCAASVPVCGLAGVLSSPSKAWGSSQQTSETARRVSPLCCFLSFWFHAGSLLALFSFFFLFFFKPVELHGNTTAPLCFFPYKCH